MEITDALNALKRMGELSAFSFSEKQSIELLYSEVLGKEFLRTSCSDCYHDAIIEMLIYLKKNGKMKKRSNYTLKNGALLQPVFGSNEMFTNESLTDEVAEKYLHNNPAGIILFASYPEDWKERSSSYGKQEIVIDDLLVNNLVESINSGASKDAIKETYKEYQINGKKLTAKEFGLHLKEAYAIVKKAKE